MNKLTLGLIFGMIIEYANFYKIEPMEVSVWIKLGINLAFIFIAMMIGNLFGKD